MEFVIISLHPLYFWNFCPPVGPIRANLCSNNFSCKQILLIFGLLEQEVLAGSCSLYFNKHA